MSVRDLPTFNLFLQLTDGVFSYQAFALGAVEAKPVVAAAIAALASAGVSQRALHEDRLPLPARPAKE